jgi:hypothetical protein
VHSQPTVPPLGSLSNTIPTGTSTSTSLYWILDTCSHVCYVQCKEGPGADPDKALWIYRDLFRCAPNRAASLSVLHEFRQLLEDQVTEDMGAGQAGTVADHFCVEAYNQGGKYLSLGGIADLLFAFQHKSMSSICVCLITTMSS